MAFLKFGFNVICFLAFLFTPATCSSSEYPLELNVGNAANVLSPHDAVLSCLCQQFGFGPNEEIPQTPLVCPIAQARFSFQPIFKQVEVAEINHQCLALCCLPSFGSSLTIGAIGKSPSCHDIYVQRSVLLTRNFGGRIVDFLSTKPTKCGAVYGGVSLLSDVHDVFPSPPSPIITANDNVVTSTITLPTHADNVVVVDSDVILEADAMVVEESHNSNITNDTASSARVNITASNISVLNDSTVVTDSSVATGLPGKFINTTNILLVSDSFVQDERVQQGIQLVKTTLSDKVQTTYQRLLSIAADVFPLQHPQFWQRVGKLLEKQLGRIHKRMAVEPTVMVLAGESSSAVTAVVDSVASIFATSLSSHVVTIDCSAYANTSSAVAKLAIDNTIANAYSHGARSFVLANAHTLHGSSSLILYKYCDHENAAYKDVLFIVHLQYGGSHSMDYNIPSVEGSIGSTLRLALLARGLDNDAYGGIWSRISHLVLYIHNTEKQEVPYQPTLFDFVADSITLTFNGEHLKASNYYEVLRLSYGADLAGLLMQTDIPILYRGDASYLTVPIAQMQMPCMEVDTDFIVDYHHEKLSIISAAYSGGFKCVLWVVDLSNTLALEYVAKSLKQSSGILNVVVYDESAASGTFSDPSLISAFQELQAVVYDQRFLYNSCVHSQMTFGTFTYFQCLFNAKSVIAIQGMSMEQYSELRRDALLVSQQRDYDFVFDVDCSHCVLMATSKTACTDCLQLYYTPVTMYQNIVNVAGGVASGVANTARSTVHHVVKYLKKSARCGGKTVASVAALSTVASPVALYVHTASLIERVAGYVATKVRNIIFWFQMIYWEHKLHNHYMQVTPLLAAPTMTEVSRVLKRFEAPQADKVYLIRTIPKCGASVLNVQFCGVYRSCTTMLDFITSYCRVSFSAEGVNLKAFTLDYYEGFSTLVHAGSNLMPACIRPAFSDLVYTDTQSSAIQYGPPNQVQKPVIVVPLFKYIDCPFVANQNVIVFVSHALIRCRQYQAVHNFIDHGAFYYVSTDSFPIVAMRAQHGAFNADFQLSMQHVAYDMVRPVVGLASDTQEFIVKPEILKANYKYKTTCVSAQGFDYTCAENLDYNDDVQSDMLCMESATCVPYDVQKPTTVSPTYLRSHAVQNLVIQYADSLVTWDSIPEYKGTLSDFISARVKDSYSCTGPPCIGAYYKIRVNDRTDVKDMCNTMGLDLFTCDLVSAPFLIA